MKVVILAGGFGTRITEESHLKPKPMVEIGGYPILWHIMKIYSAQGFNEFVICLGYKGYIIKEYFANYYLKHSDVAIDFSVAQPKVNVLSHETDPWKVTLVETGLNTMTGGRLLRIKALVEDNDFMMTYGDGVGNVNLNALISKHKESKGIATLTATQPSGRFGALGLDENLKVTSFAEKPKSHWINAGFFVLTPKIFNYLEDDNTIFEESPLRTLAQEGNLFAYQHTDYWQPMDTMRDRNVLEELWKGGTAPWKVW